MRLRRGADINQIKETLSKATPLLRLRSSFRPLDINAFSLATTAFCPCGGVEGPWEVRGSNGLNEAWHT